MLHWGANSLRVRLSILSLLATGCALLVAGAGLAYFDQRAELNERVEDIRGRADAFLRSQRAALDFRDELVARSALEDFARRNGVDFAELSDSELGSLTSVGQRPPRQLRLPSDDELRFFDRQFLLRRELELGSGRRAELLLLADLSELRERALRLALLLLAATSLALLASQLLVRRLLTWITGPIEELAAVAREISRSRDYKRRVDISGSDELSTFARFFNEMLAQIESRDEALRQANDLLEERVAERTRELRQEVELRKQVEAQLTRAKDEATSAASAKSEFLANMSHEIRTPLIGVIGMAELLQDSKLDELQRQYAETLVGSAQHLLTLINDLLDYSRIAAGGMQLEETEFDLSEVLYETAQLLVPVARDKGVEIAVDYPLSMPRRVVGDPARVRQVLINLVGNAVKFTQQGSVAIAACVEGHRGAELLLQLAVRDTGIGIPSHKLDSIFEQFTQADASTTRQYGGTGLGLAITRSLTELMGGRVTVQSAVGQGTSFELHIPFREAAAQKPVPMPDRDWSHVRALVVMPAGEPRSIVLAMLQRLGLEVSCIDREERSEFERRLKASTTAKYPALVFADAGEEPDRTLAMLRSLSSDLGDQSPWFVLLADLVQLSADRQLQGLVGGFVLRKPLRHEDLVRLLNLVVHDGEDAGAGRARRALLAEDNVVNQRIVAAMLERCGFEVSVVADGQAALSRAKQEQFDLILMDCHMPEMDGLRATRNIRELPSEMSRALIVGMLSSDRSVVSDACLRAGMNEVLSKPITFAKLEALAQRHFSLAVV